MACAVRATSVVRSIFFDSSKSVLPVLYFLLDGSFTRKLSSSSDFSMPNVVLLLMERVRAMSVTPRGLFSLTISFMTSTAFLSIGALYMIHYNERSEVVMIASRPAAVNRILQAGHGLTRNEEVI